MGGTALLSHIYRPLQRIDWERSRECTNHHRYSELFCRAEAQPTAPVHFICHSRCPSHSTRESHNIECIRRERYARSLRVFEITFAYSSHNISELDSSESRFLFSYQTCG